MFSTLRQVRQLRKGGREGGRRERGRGERNKAWPLAFRTVCVCVQCVLCVLCELCVLCVLCVLCMCASGVACTRKTRTREGSLPRQRC